MSAGTEMVCLLGQRQCVGWEYAGTKTVCMLGLRRCHCWDYAGTKTVCLMGLRRCFLCVCFLYGWQKRHCSSDSAASGRDRSYSTDSADTIPSRLKEESWLLELSNTFLQQYIQYLQSTGFILVQIRPQSPARKLVLYIHIYRALF